MSQRTESTEVVAKEKRPSVFIGSSREGVDIAEAIQANIDRECQAKIWSQGVFGLSCGTLESLTNSLDSYDFAILVLTPDDLNISRETTIQAPRDNVLLEMGMFIGAVGRLRTFIVYDSSKDLKLPSDLAGITPATYRPHDDGNLRAALGSACTEIKQAIREQGARSRGKLQGCSGVFDLEHAENIARNYDAIRRTARASAIRNAQMTKVVKEIQKATRNIQDFPLQKWISDQSAGKRLLAYVFLYENPDPDLINLLATQVCLKESKLFNLLWGGFALRQCIGEFYPDSDSSSTIDEIGSDFDLSELAEQLATLRKRIKGGSDILFVISQIEEMILL